MSHITPNKIDIASSDKQSVRLVGNLFKPKTMLVMRIVSENKRLSLPEIQNLTGFSRSILTNSLLVLKKLKLVTVTMEANPLGHGKVRFVHASKEWPLNLDIKIY